MIYQLINSKKTFLPLKRYNDLKDEEFNNNVLYNEKSHVHLDSKGLWTRKWRNSNKKNKGHLAKDAKKILSIFLSFCLDCRNLIQ